MEWLTTHGNYSNYCGGTGNRGKSKAQHHKDLAIMIKNKLPESSRTEKDVENKIVALERQFREASDWANNTGQGVDDPGDFEAAILKRCPHYHQLEDIMKERPNAKPLATNEGSPVYGSDNNLDGNNNLDGDNNFDDDLDDDAALLNDGDDASLCSNKAADHGAVKEAMKAPRSSSTVSTVSSAASKRLKASSDEKKKKKKQKKESADDIINNFIGDPSNLQSLRCREVEAREKEANARMLEATAIAAKAEKETSILGIDEKVKLLRERRRLLEDGICTQEELDRVLPLPN
jgi:hypothetical protein